MIRPPLTAVLATMSDAAAIVASSVQAASPRSLIAARSESHPISPGAIAGAVIGSVVGAVVVAVCAYPFIVRSLRRRRGVEKPFSPEAEMEAAAAGRMSSPSSPIAPTGDSTRRLSVDCFVPGSPRQAQPVKEYDMNGNHFEAERQHHYNNNVASAAYPSPEHQHDGGFVQEPQFVHQPDMGVGRVGTFRTLETLDTTGTTTPTHGPSRRSTKSSLSNAFRSATAVFRRTSTRSIHSQGLGSPMYSPPLEYSPQGVDRDPTFSLPQTTFSPVDNIPPTTGEAAAYYSGAPMSPPTSVYSPVPPQPVYPGAARGSPSAHVSPDRQPPHIVPQQQQQLFSDVDFSPMSPTSPRTSPPIKEEVASEDEEMTASTAMFQMEGGVAPKLAKRMTFPKQGPQMPMSPNRAGPGTVNPMDIMAPTNASERSWMIQKELIKIENSPPPPTLQALPPSVDQQQHSQQHQQPLPVTPNNLADYASPDSMPGDTSMDDYINLDGPVEHPTQDALSHQQQAQALGLGQGYPQACPHTPTYIKPEPDTDTNPQLQTPGFDVSDYSSPQPDSQSSGLSNQNTPDTGLTNPGSQSTDNPSPVSRPPSTPVKFPGVTGPDVSPKTAFTCDRCERIFDQVHKLNHHRRYHERPHECPYDGCPRGIGSGQGFGTKTHLDRHINDKHIKTKKYHCTVDGCQFSRTGDRAFPRKDNWRRHMQNKHGLNPDHDPPEIVDHNMGGYAP